jgi:adenosine kinase
MFDGAELTQFIDQATWMALNDYEARMLCERTGRSLETLSDSHLRGVVVTLGAAGCDVWERGQRTHVPGVAAGRWSIRPAAAMPSGRRCCTASSATGRCSAARARQPVGRDQDRAARRQNHVLDRTELGIA